MEESTKLLFAYFSLLIGFPLIAAKALWCVPGALTAPVFTRIAGRLDMFVADIAEGFLSFLLARQIFEQLYLSVVWQVPLILILVTWFWNCSRPDGLRAFPSVLGIIAGIVLCPGGLVYPPILLLAGM
ncbi:MAG: hypothetical protein ACYC7J_07285 [Syntrophales bacterium]